MSAFRIRGVQMDDAAALAEIFRAPSVVANTYRRGDTTQEDVLRLLDRMGDHQRGLVAVTPDGSPVGFLALMRHAPEPAAHAAEFYVVVAEAWQQKGVGRSLVEKALSVAFEEWGLARVELEVLADNANALALYEGIGFRREGVKRASYNRDGTLVDSVVMGLLREEWKA